MKHLICHDRILIDTSLSSHRTMGIPNSLALVALIGLWTIAADEGTGLEFIITYHYHYRGLFRLRIDPSQRRSLHAVIEQGPRNYLFRLENYDYYEN